MPRETECLDQNSPHWTLWQRSWQNGTNKNSGKQGSAVSRPISTGLSCLGRAKTVQLLPSWRVVPWGMGPEIGPALQGMALEV